MFWMGAGPLQLKFWPVSKWQSQSQSTIWHAVVCSRRRSRMFCSGLFDPPTKKLRFGHFAVWVLWLWPGDLITACWECWDWEWEQSDWEQSTSSSLLTFVLTKILSFVPQGPRPSAAKRRLDPQQSFLSYEWKCRKWGFGQMKKKPRSKLQVIHVSIRASILNFKGNKQILSWAFAELGWAGHWAVLFSVLLNSAVTFDVHLTHHRIVLPSGPSVALNKGSFPAGKVQLQLHMELTVHGADSLAAHKFTISNQQNQNIFSIFSIWYMIYAIYAMPAICRRRRLLFLATVKKQLGCFCACSLSTEHSPLAWLPCFLFSQGPG